jgi:hypothetical protein
VGDSPRERLLDDVEGSLPIAGKAEGIRKKGQLIPPEQAVPCRFIVMAGRLDKVVEGFRHQVLSI